ISNPKITLLKALDEAGVSIILCLQKAAYRNIVKTDLNPKVEIVSSAMKDLVT
ncbi:MAG: DsrE family protein, partial [Flavobacteriaceae bacterium]|nr:DsrE family protein [Flavobacteriaceae bacterium]